MNLDPNAVRLRLTPSQVSVIWPGLHRIATCLQQRAKQKDYFPYSFPFRLYPCPGRDRGRFDQFSMETIGDLANRLRPKTRTGGRVRLSAIEIRAAIFAIRVNSDWLRYKRWEHRESRPRTLLFLGVDQTTLEKVRRRSACAIHSLERHLKRANALLKKSAGVDTYQALMSQWRSHVKWIRLHLIYFRPYKGVASRSKSRYQAILNDLERVARRAIAEAGYRQPDARELRHVVRLFARYSRWGNFGSHDARWVISSGHATEAKSEMLDFVVERINLERVTDERQENRIEKQAKKKQN